MLFGICVINLAVTPYAGGGEGGLGRSWFCKSLTMISSYSLLQNEFEIARRVKLNLWVLLVWYQVSIFEPTSPSLYWVLFIKKIHTSLIVVLGLKLNFDSLVWRRCVHTCYWNWCKTNTWLALPHVPSRLGSSMGMALGEPAAPTVVQCWYCFMSYQPG
jgi:hypothetical protein